MEETTELYNITKHVEIKRSKQDVFDFVSNVNNWPKYMIYSVKSVEKGDGNYWNIMTPSGPGKMLMRADRDSFVLDYEYISDDMSFWKIPARVVDKGKGAVFLITLLKPDEMPKEVFEESIKNIDEELGILKKIMEEQQK